MKIKRPDKFFLDHKRQVLRDFNKTLPFLHQPEKVIEGENTTNGML